MERRATMSNQSNPDSNANQDFFELPIKSLIFLIKRLKLKDLLIKNITDPRSPLSRKYDLYSLLMMALSTSFFRSSSKNEFHLNFQRNDIPKAFLKFVEMDSKTIPCVRTIDDLLLKIDPKELEDILPSIFKTLIESKLFQLHPELKRDGAFCFALDAHTSHYYHENSQHPCEMCSYCMKRTHGNKTYYLHTEVILSFIAPNGLQIPILIHRMEGNPKWNGLSEKKLKQECELTAFPIVMKKLRELFPRLRIHLLLDALYCNDPVFTLLGELKISFSIVKKPKVLKTVGEDCEGLRKLIKPISRTYSNNRFDVVQSIQFFNDIAYRSHKLSVIQVDEKATKKPSKRFAKVHIKESRWEWIESTEVTAENATKKADGNRLRWYEEDLFNTAENRGFNMQHDFGRAPKVQTIWLYFILIAMTLTALLEYSSLGRIFNKKSLKFVMKQMLEHLLYLNEIKIFSDNFPGQLRFGAPEPPVSFS